MSVGLLGAACGLLLGIVPAARASFPGSPGEIVFSSTFAGNREIYVAAHDGSGRTDVSRDPQAADITPSWSADGRRIAFASNRSGAMEIYLMNADGSNVVQVTDEGAYADDPRFTADGRFIVYESKLGGNWEIRRIGVDGSGDVDLTLNRANDRSPVTSPNGRLVAFSSNRGTSGTHIWVMSIRGKALRRVTTAKGVQTDPAWAPFGGRLAYVARVHGGGGTDVGTNIWTVLATGKRARQLTTRQDRAELNPAWSPDARSIVYQDCAPGNVTTCTLSVQALGESPVDISNLRAPFVDPFDNPSDRFGQVFHLGNGAASVEGAGELVETLAADASQGGPQDNIVAGWSTSGCTLTGNFDVQAEYQMTVWPQPAGATVALTFPGLPASMNRTSEIGNESYVSAIPPLNPMSMTTDTAGTLRMQREGDTAVPSYLGPSGWITIGSGHTSTNDTGINLEVSSGFDSFQHQPVEARWSNLRVNSGAISCPTTWWEDDSPDWQAVN